MSEPTKILDVRQEVVPANGELEIQYDYEPSGIEVVLEEAPSAGLRWYIEGAQGGGGKPLLSQGPFIFPGVKANQKIRIVSSELVNMPVTITAWRGVVAPATATPQVSARSTSVEIQSQQTSEPSTNPLSLQYNHLGRYAVVFIAYTEYAVGAPHRTVASVNLGGAAGSLLGSANIANSTTGWTNIEAWLVDQQTQGVQTLTITYSGAGGQAMSVLVLSYTAAIRMGNVASASRNTPGSISYTIVGQDAASVIFSVTMSLSDPTSVHAETAGASPFVPIHLIPVTCQFGIFTRQGTGTHTFSYSLTGGTPRTLVAISLEVLPI